MISKEETYRTFYNESDDNYYMHYKNIQENSNFEWEELTSNITLVSKEELNKILKLYGYFNPRS